MTSARLCRFDGDHRQSVITLFQEVFTASEGGAEGQLIAQLVADLIATTAQEDLLGCLSVEQNTLLGGVFFSRFWLPEQSAETPAQSAFILSPMAIAAQRQGCGLGQQLITYGLDQLAERKVDWVFTYGDPAFYGKLGFEPLGQDRIAAPFALSQPEGWLVRSLGKQPVPVIPGATRCVPALSHPEYW